MTVQQIRTADPLSAEAIRALTARVKELEAALASVPCSTGSFHHTPEQWRSCRGCSIKRGALQLDSDAGEAGA